MAHLPGSLDGLLSLVGGCFTQPTFQTFRALALGFVSQTRARTVCGMLVGARLAGVWEHCRAHRFFSRARWCTDELGLRLLDLIAERLLGAEDPLELVIDDTLLRRSGRKVFGAHWHYDPTANSNAKTSAWGNNWVVVGVGVRLPFMSRPVCLPVLARLWRPKRKPHAGTDRPDPERPSKPELARALVDLVAARHPDRTVHVVGDAAYGSRAWRGLAKRVTITFRLRADAALYAPPPPQQGKRGRGRPPVKGAKLPSLAAIAASPKTVWRRQAVRRYGRSEQTLIGERRCLWYRSLGGVPLRLILVRDPGEEGNGYELALLTTDLDSSAAEIVGRYADRWSIEVSFEDAKGVFGVGEARNRKRHAVERTAPFGFFCMTLTILWYALHGHSPEVVAERRARAPWYRTKVDPSVADMLVKLRRVIIAAQFRPGLPPAPTAREINEVQMAWAAAGV